MNFETVIPLDDLRAHDAQIVRNGGNAIGFLNPQLLRMANDGCAIGQRTSDREDGQLVDELRHFFSLDNCAFDACDFDDSARLELIDIFDGFAHLRAHSYQDTEQCRSRIIQADMAHQQMTSGLCRSRDQPKSGRGNVARNCEIARLRQLVAENTDTAIAILCGPHEKIIKHQLGVVAAG